MKRVNNINPLPTTTGSNSTIANNTALNNGGGIYVREGSLELYYFTIVGNRANLSEGDSTVNQGGGVYVLDSYYGLGNSIVAGNYNGSGSSLPDDLNTGSLIARALNSRNTLIGDAGSADGLVNGTNGNIVGINGTGTRGIYSILRYNSLFTAPNGTFYYPLRPGSPAIDAASFVTIFGKTFQNDVRGRDRRTDGNSDEVSTPDMGAFEAIPPTLSLKVDPSINFTEHGAPKIIAPSIYPIDPDQSGYSNGRLRVFSKVPHNSDRIAIRNQGTAAGKIGISGSNVTFGGVTFGTFSGGTGVTPLVINFLSNASTQMVASLMKSITFQAVGNDIGRSNGGGATRIEFELTDSTGGTSSGAEVLIRVYGINDAPVLSTASPPSLSGVNGATGIAVSALLAGITDPDGSTVAKGLAIATADGTFAGKWQYSLNNGTNWVDFGAVSKSAALLLPDLGIVSRIRFVRTSGTAPLTIKLGYYAWDQSQGTIGTKEDISQASKHGGSGAYSINFRNSTATI
jgi:predicted outer membrane repeat protein